MYKRQQKASTRALPQPELFGEEPQEQEAVKPQKAAPQDLQYIQKNWTAIVRETSGLLKQMLKEATPKYNANSDEPILYIEFHNFQAEICTKNPDTIPLLKKIIREKTGKEVEIQFVITDTDLKGPAGLTPISSSWDCLPLWKWIPCIPPPDRQKHCLLSFLQGKSCFLRSS